jgi:hypothetical protein
MATNEIEIEVVLNARKAEEGLESLKDEGESLGESLGGVSSAISTLGGEVGEKMVKVGETVSGVTGSMKDLGKAAKASKGSFVGLLGPIGLVAVALYEAYKVLNEFFDNAEDRQLKLGAYEEAIGEVSGAIQELTTDTVNLTNAEIEQLETMTESAKAYGAEAANVRKGTSAIKEQIIAIEQRMAKRVEELSTFRDGELRYAEGSWDVLWRMQQLNKDAAKLGELQTKLAEERAKAAELDKSSAKEAAKASELKEELAKRGEKALKERVKAEAEMTYEAQLKTLQAQEQNERTKTEIAKLEAQRRYRELSQIENVNQDVIDRAVIAENKALQHRLKQIAEEEARAQRLRNKQAAALRKMALAKRLSEERQAQLELARVTRAEIENQRLLGGDRLELLEQELALELGLIGDNQRVRTALTLEYANKRLVIQQEIDRKRLEDERKASEESKRIAEEERRQAEKIRALALDGVEFDIRMQSEGIEKELALLELRYMREMTLRDRSEAEITELTRRYNAERTRMIEENANQGFEAVKSSLVGMGETIQRSMGQTIYDSFTSVKAQSREAFKDLNDQYKKEQERIRQSSEDAATINEQMTELTANYAREREKIRKAEQGAPSRMIGEMLTALGKQAAVEALMYTAKAAASAFIDPGAAGGYLAAAGIMGTAAAVAGYSGAQLSGIGGSAYSSGSIGPESPTGSPQSAPAPERERADSTAMVFNINFGNSTIYDTKRAAQDAMASEILRTLNRQRRGAPRFAMG